MNNELTTSLVARITEAHSLFQLETGTFREALLRAANAMREAGTYLIELKDQVAHGSWEEMFSDHGDERKTRFPFTGATARNYMRFANANPVPITDIAEGVRSVKDLMINSGALPARTHGDQSLHADETNFFVNAGKQLMAFGSLWDKQEKHHPVSQWTQETAEAFVAQMEPVIEKVNGIYAQAKERALGKAA